MYNCFAGEDTMKYIVLLCDGMADYPVEELGGKTPMSVAKKPHMEKLAASGEIGTVKTVADGLSPGSDVANLSVMGYDPFLYYSGRSPLEAASIGISLSEQDVATRCNLVTLSDEPVYADKTMVDYCADDISTEEADELIACLQQAIGDDAFSFFTGVSYRHCLVWRNAPAEIGSLTPPHDISGQPVRGRLPACREFLALMEKSYALLKDHPVNQKRVARGQRPANSIWLWGSGHKKSLPQFVDKCGLQGAVISAVDLLKGIGKLTGMEVIEVEGATGYIDTNFAGKAKAALDALADGKDFVYLHVEAPDECGHRHEITNKVRAIELIDEQILGALLEGLRVYDGFKIMILPDHATPLALKTHTSDPVPFLIYDSRRARERSVEVFDEENAAKTGVYVAEGPTLMDRFLQD